MRSPIQILTWAKRSLTGLTELNVYKSPSAVTPRLNSVEYSR